MKLFIASIVLFSSSVGSFGVCHAEETVGEKAQATTKSVKRSGKKGIHRASEAMCGTLTGDNKLQCLAKKSKNRVEEGKDAVIDKGSEMKNAVDTDKH